jgi:hypothetical protein
MHQLAAEELWKSATPLDFPYQNADRWARWATPSEADRGAGRLRLPLEDDQEPTARSTCSAWRSNCVGVLVVLLNLAAMVALAKVVPSIQKHSEFYRDYSQNLEERLNEQYWFCLTAACPRCALMGAGLMSNPNKSQECQDGIMFWIMWVLVPGLQAAICSSGIDKEGVNYCNSFGCRAYLYMDMSATVLCDFSYFIVFAGLLGFGKVKHSILYGTGYVVRQFLLWFMVGVLRSVVWKTPVLEGAHLGFTMLVLSLIFVLRVATVLITARLIKSWYSGSEPELSVYLGSMFGAIVAFPTILYSGFALPSRPLGAMGCVVIIVYPLLVWVLRPRGVAHFVVGPVFNTMLLYEFLANALADFLLLEKLRHKTSLSSFLSIHLTGGLALQGGSLFGSTSGAQVSDDTFGKFYVFKDSFSGRPIQSCGGRCTEEVVHTEAPVVAFDPIHFVMPNLHGFMASRNTLTIPATGKPYPSLMASPDYSPLFKFVLGVLASMWGVVMVVIPSIKFYCSLDDLHKQPFYDDPSYKGYAWFTRRDVPAWWIGFGGALMQGARQLVCGQWCRDAVRSPMRTAMKLISGTVFLTLAILWLLFVDSTKALLSIAILQWL